MGVPWDLWRRFISFRDQRTRNEREVVQWYSDSFGFVVVEELRKIKGRCFGGSFGDRRENRGMIECFRGGIFYG